MKTTFTDGVGIPHYIRPSVETFDVSVEQGFATSDYLYGDPGAAGDYLEPGNEYEL